MLIRSILNFVAAVSTKHCMYRSLLASSGIRTMTYQAVERGTLYTETFRLYIEKDGKPVSPFHDIPLYAKESEEIYNMVCEIPRWTNAKMEMSTKETLNPIKQDIKKGKVRFVDNVFPHHGYIWNYGALPQTWEDPNHISPDTRAKGDNDPIDVIEIGQRVCKRGDVLQVKVLGTLALIDEGETDWKLVAIDIKDPIAQKLNDINDVEDHFPGLLRATHEWFKLYKIPTGKPENQFAFGGTYKNKTYAHQIIKETHEFWKKLVNSDDTHGLDCGQMALSEVRLQNLLVQVLQLRDSNSNAA